MKTEINQAYKMWRARAVEEALALQDIDATDVPKSKKDLAGAAAKISWEDPRRLARKGQTRAPSWTGACSWLLLRLKEFEKQLLVLELGIGEISSATTEEQYKWCRQLAAAKARLRKSRN